MAVDPSTPAKAASGIVVDPETQSRVVPASRRADGSVRKEQKVRAGFVPQEDIGVFRGRRQREREAAAKAGGGVPGSSNGSLGAQATAYLLGDDKPSPNAPPAASAPAPTPGARPATPPAKPTPTLASFESPGRSWDAVSDSDEDEDVARAFAALSVDKDEAFPALGAAKAEQPGAAAGKDGVSGTGRGKRDAKPGGGGDKSQPTSAKTPELRSTPPAPSETTASWRRAPPPTPPSSLGTRKPQPKPHPIQGGRRGPIGLAHPPPIDDAATETDARYPPTPQRGGRGAATPRGGRGGGGGGGRGGWRRNAEPGRADGEWRRPAAAPERARGEGKSKPGKAAQSTPAKPARTAGGKGDTTPATKSETTPAAKPETKPHSKSAPSQADTPPRARDPVRVRAGGAPADRVRNILLQNAQGAERK